MLDDLIGILFRILTSNQVMIKQNKNLLVLQQSFVNKAGSTYSVFQIKRAPLFFSIIFFSIMKGSAARTGKKHVIGVRFPRIKPEYRPAQAKPRIPETINSASAAFPRTGTHTQVSSMPRGWIMRTIFSTWLYIIGSFPSVEIRTRSESA